MLRTEHGLPSSPARLHSSKVPKVATAFKCYLDTKGHTRPRSHRDYPWDSVVAHDIKLCSHMSHLVADDSVTKYQIAVDIRAFLASRRTRHEVSPITSHTTFPSYNVVSGPAFRRTWKKHAPHSTSPYMSSPGDDAATTLTSTCRLRLSN